MTVCTTKLNAISGLTVEGFRHYFLNTTNQPQLTGHINQTANNIQRTFPAGLMTSVGVVVANPAYGEDPVSISLPNEISYGSHFLGLCAELHNRSLSWHGCLVVEFLGHDGARTVSN